MDKGLYKEYLTLQEIHRLIPGHHHLLASVYLPKAKGHELTEVDIVLIHTSGIYAVESKNYSGWIFGREEDYKWTCSLSNRQKNRFYNPIKQNQTHIKALQKTLSNINPLHFRSLVVFSEGCELKSVTVSSDHVQVLKRNNLAKAWKRKNGITFSLNSK
ncbi:NERD domain-containing protein [Viridibacillus sp. YIM B01967]|uniref:NERD domain-containing protein n=1 Tax=Viridibacillus soli TaxID=2798301 RepID=A0ABS1HCP6_9BACL|nr:nuclease-related domain-containing protein [Viridibacillus soli]MBK3497214.1 NERD domain-containing protein [Viridibacillus soli]